MEIFMGLLNRNPIFEIGEYDLTKNTKEDSSQ